MKQESNRPAAPRRPQARGITVLCIAAALLLILVGLIASPRFRHQLTRSLEPGPTQPAGLQPNPYGPEDFAFDGDYLTCTAGPARLGVDVSSHQKDIDWTQVREAGMEFAMVRIGYRGTGADGAVHPDDYAAQNLQGAREAGLQVGAYFFSQALTVPEAAAEAAHCIAFLQDWELDLPVVFDWEYAGADARSAQADPETLLLCAQTFCQAMEDAGYQPMVYFNPHVAGTYLDVAQLSHYPFWLALYAVTLWG